MTSDNDSNSSSDNALALLDRLVERAKSMASQLTGAEAEDSACHFCTGPLAPWECILVSQLTGVPAHIDCPEETLRRHLSAIGPVPDFDYAALSAAVDRRLIDPWPEHCSGETKPRPKSAVHPETH